MIDHNIASWNVRGGHSISKLLDIRKLIKENNINLIALSETKLDLKGTLQAHRIIMKDWMLDHNLDHAPYGRLLILWNPRIFCLNRLHSTTKLMHYSVLHIPTQTNFNATFVYAFNNAVSRQSLLFSLPQLDAHIPWICTGDFNCMHHSSHKIGGTPLTLRDITPLSQALLYSIL